MLEELLLIVIRSTSISSSLEEAIVPPRDKLGEIVPTLYINLREGLSLHEHELPSSSQTHVITRKSSSVSSPVFPYLEFDILESIHPGVAVPCASGFSSLHWHVSRV